MALGGYAAPSEADLFDVEYWELEQAKLARQPAPGAARRPGRAGDRGRVGHRPGVRPGAARRGRRGRRARPGRRRRPTVADGPAFVGVAGDVTDPPTVDAAALALAVRALRRPRPAGAQRRRLPAAPRRSPSSTPRVVGPRRWRSTPAPPPLRCGPPTRSCGGRPPAGSVVVVGVEERAGARAGAPPPTRRRRRRSPSSPGSRRWSGASDGIRVNVVHPDAVFDTALWDRRRSSPSGPPATG